MVNPKSNFRYTVGSPLVREDLPQDLLDRATHVNFDDMHKGGLISESIVDFVQTLDYLFKVKTLWEGHKIWKKSPTCFDKTAVFTQ